MYIEKSRFLFIHIPKTGGISLRNAINNKELAINYLPFHFHVLDIRLLFGDKIFSDLFKFSLVRNPWDLVVSKYFFIKKTSKNNKLKNISFSEYVKNETLFLDSFANFYNKNSLATKMYNSRESYGSQFDLISENENLLVRTLKLEELNDISLIDSIGFLELQPLRQLNKTEHTNYKDYYTSETKEIIAKRFEKDIDYFKYTFDS